MDKLPVRKVSLESLGTSEAYGLTFESHGLKSSNEIAEPKSQDIRFEHSRAGETLNNQETTNDNYKDAHYEWSKFQSGDGCITATEAVEKPRAHNNCIGDSPRLKANHGVDVEIPEDSTPEKDIELQEYRRKIEKQSHEHTDNVFRDKRLKKQKEAEARLSGRPQGREDAREMQSCKLGRRIYPQPP